MKSLISKDKAVRAAIQGAWRTGLRFSITWRNVTIRNIIHAILEAKQSFLKVQTKPGALSSSTVAIFFLLHRVTSHVSNTVACLAEWMSTSILHLHSEACRVACGSLGCSCLRLRPPPRQSASRCTTRMAQIGEGVFIYNQLILRELGPFQKFVIHCIT